MEPGVTLSEGRFLWYDLAIYDDFCLISICPCCGLGMDFFALKRPDRKPPRLPTVPIALKNGYS